VQVSEQLRLQLDTLPGKPGCYLMKDTDGKVIYVGKAINLRNRVRSYFHTSATHSRKISQMVDNIGNIEWIVVASELEALILEMNLIKKHRPFYNVRLKDDKRYPYIKVHWGDPFPKVTVTRQMIRDGSRYFGPYTSVWAVHQTLDFLRRIFSYLSCDREITGKDERACLYFDIKLCCAPCIGNADQPTYRQMIDDICQFLDGRTEKIITRLQLEMGEASEKMEFEHAASLRDQIRAIETVVEHQKIISSDFIDSDILALARSDGDACVQVFFVRGGKLIGRDYFLLEGAAENTDTSVLTEFIKQFYNQASTIPSRVLLPQEIEEAQIIRQWLSQRREDQKVEISVPREGPQQELIQMAAENASETLLALQAQWQADRHKQEEGLLELQQTLNLTNPLNRIECYDISNIQGTAAVGSMVVFEQGIPKKNLYRRFNIRNVIGPDDFASMEELLTRRFNRWKSAQDFREVPGKKPDQAFSRLPDLLIVDGGKGQLSRAVSVLENFYLSATVPVVGLAKQNEELFLPSRMDAIIMPRNSQGLYLIQRIRDEAHRFAISSHRNLRTKTSITSSLDAIPGIGPKRRKLLLEQFDSLDLIQDATIDQLTAIPGITTALAHVIKEQLA